MSRPGRERRIPSTKTLEPAADGTDDLSQVRLAYLERSGQISFVRR